MTRRDIDHIRLHLLAQSATFTTPGGTPSPDAELCCAEEFPTAWYSLTTGLTSVMLAADVVHARHLEDIGYGGVRGIIADATRDTAIAGVDWVWERLVGAYVDRIGDRSG